MLGANTCQEEMMIIHLKFGVQALYFYIHPSSLYDCPFSSTIATSSIFYIVMEIFGKKYYLYFARKLYIFEIVQFDSIVSRKRYIKKILALNGMY